MMIKRGNRRRSVIGFEDLKTLIYQDVCGNHTDERLVVDDQCHRADLFGRLRYC